MNMFGFRKNIGSIGLDIGHDSIKMLQLCHRQGQLSVLHSHQVPIGHLADEPAPQQALVTILKKTVEKGGFKGKQVVSCLPNDILRITSVQLDTLDSLKMGVNINKEAVYRFGFDPDVDAIRYIHAGEVRRGDNSKQEIILFAVDNNSIRQHLDLLESAGLIPVGIDPLPCALLRGFNPQMRRQTDKKRAVVYVDIGAHCSTVVFGVQGDICFIKQIPMGTRYFDQAIATKLAVDMPEAQRLRLRHQEIGIHTLDMDKCNEPTDPVGPIAPEIPPTAMEYSLDPASQQVITEAVMAACESLVHEVSLCFRYYAVTFRGQQIGHAVISGGGAHEPLLLEACKRHLPCDVGPAQAFQGIHSVDGLSQGRRTEWAVAVGLALKGMNMSHQHQQKADKPRITQLSAVG